MTELLERPPGLGELAPHISESWHRARLAGLTPSGPLRVTTTDVAPDSHLLQASGPVLDELVTDLLDTDVSVLLADKDCRLVRRWCAHASLAAAFDSLNLADGVQLLEENIGTNGLGTAMETRRPVMVHGEEHFAEPLKDFSCYGHPIMHPLTRRLEGVLDVSMLAPRAGMLVGPLVARAVRDIERRLLDRSGVSERALLAAFRRASVQRMRPIVALGDDVVLTNKAASDLLCATDMAVLRVLADDVGAGTVTRQVALESGRRVSAQVTRLDDVRNAVLVRVDAESGQSSRVGSGRHRMKAQTISTGDVVLISGPPGSGRTTRARERLAGLSVAWLGATTAPLDGAEAWAGSLRAAAQDRSEAICIDDVDLLPDPLLEVVTQLLDQSCRPPLVLTSTSVPHLHGRAAILAGAATEVEELLPLAARRVDIPGVAAEMLRAEAGGAALHLSPGVLQALSSHSWPGNLSELQRVLAQAARRRSVGALVLDDLPESYRLADRSVLNARDRAERDVILGALTASDGNKVKAARELGMSRTTLYARMRSLKISSY